jgi:hypothetical protein
VNLRHVILGCVAVLLSGASADAEELLYRNKAVTCFATSPQITGLKVEGVRFWFTYFYAWGKARVRVLTADGIEEIYVVSGSANLIRAILPRNDFQPSFAYRDVECTVKHRNIVSVRDCLGTEASMTCDVGLEFWKSRHAYSVSLTVEAAEAAAR